MVTLQSSATATPYYQQTLAPKGLLEVTKPVLTTPQQPNNQQKKTPHNPPKEAQFKPLPPWQWALGAGSITGLLAGSVGALIVGKRYEVPLVEGGGYYYNQKPFNQICIEFNQKLVNTKAPDAPSTFFRSHTYTYKTVADKTQVLTALDVFGEKFNREYDLLLRLSKLPAGHPLGEEGYWLGSPQKNQPMSKIDTSYPFAIYNEKGKLQHFFLPNNQTPYFKIEWQGESFKGSIPTSKDGKTFYVNVITGSINQETGLLSALPEVTLNEQRVTNITKIIESAQELLKSFHDEKIPLKLPVTAPPTLPAEAKLVKFPTHRFASFAVGAMPIALVVTFVVGLVQWCLPPTKKKQPKTPFQIK